MNKTLIVSRELCRQLLTVEDCIPAMHETLTAAAQGQVTMLQRSMIPHDSGCKLAIMPATMIPRQVTGAKVIIFPGAAARETSQGIVPLFDTETGALKAIVDAELITVVRTAATSGAATDILARKDASVCAILGTGKQGRAHARAMAAVRPIRTLCLWDKVPAAVEAAMAELREALPGVELVPCATPEEAVREAHIVCTTTWGRDLVLAGAALMPGAHVNAVGACSAASREVDTETVRRSKVYFDWKEASLRDGGDLVIPLQQGELTEEHFMGDLGLVPLGLLEGRTSDSEITLFESVGLSVQDVAAANLIYRRALEQNLGVWVEI